MLAQQPAVLSPVTIACSTPGREAVQLPAGPQLESQGGRFWLGLEQQQAGVGCNQLGIDKGQVQKETWMVCRCRWAIGRIKLMLTLAVERQHVGS